MLTGSEMALQANGTFKSVRSGQNTYFGITGLAYRNILVYPIPTFGFVWSVHYLSWFNDILESD